MKEVKWTDGWHETEDLMYLVENHRFVRGVKNGVTVYPYLPSKLGGYDNESGCIIANKRNFSKILWA